MKIQDSDTSTLIAALQSNLPGAEDDARMRARLATAGVCLGMSSVIGAAALTAATTNGAATSATVGTGAAQGASMVAGAKGAGLVATLVNAVPLTGGVGVKVLVAVGVIVAGTSYPLLSPRVTTVQHATNGTDQSASIPQRVGDVAARVPTKASLDVHLPASATERIVVASSEAPDALPKTVARGVSPRQDSPNAASPSARVPDPKSAGKSVGGTVAGAYSARSHEDANDSALNGHERNAPSDQPTSASEAPSTANTQAGILAAETLLIERALRAQRAGDSAAARNWLNIHQQKFPVGKLTIERRRIWAQLQD